MYDDKHVYLKGNRTDANGNRNDNNLASDIVPSSTSAIVSLYSYPL
jgi:hypothetical protein